MDRKISYRKLLLLHIYLTIGILLVLKWPSDFSIDLKINYFVLLSAYFIIIGLFFIVTNIYKIDIFDPFIFVSILYIGIFILKPIIDLLSLSIYSHGKDISGGCIKATIIFIISYLCFCLGYVYQKNLKKEDENINLYLKKEDEKKLNLAMFIWIISIILCLIHLKSVGFSIEYIFSFGSKGNLDKEPTNSVLLFLSNFAVTLITSWMYILVYSRNKVLKIVITLIMAIYLIMRGGRWLLLIFFGAPIIYYYTKRKKRPSMVLLLIILTIVLCIFAFVQVTRSGIKHGNGIIFEKFTPEILLAPFESDLGTYKIFYGLVESIPRRMSFQFGKSIIVYTLIMFIPRAIWPSKPISPVHEVVEVAINYSARISGSAFPNIGEYYYEFGVLGCIIFMVIFGIVVGKISKLGMSDDKEKIILYSVLVPFLFQWTARGSFPHNFYSTIFLILPYFLIKLIKNKIIN